MSGWAWAFVVAMTWLIVGFVIRHRIVTAHMITKRLPKRATCAIRRHQWGQGISVKAEPGRPDAYFSAFYWRCLRCGCQKRVFLHREPVAVRKDSTDE